MTKEDAVKMLKDTLEHLKLNRDMPKEEYQRTLDGLVQTIEDPGIFTIEVLNLLYKCKSKGLYHVFNDIITMHHHILKLYHDEMCS